MEIGGEKLDLRKGWGERKRIFPVLLPTLCYNLQRNSCPYQSWGSGSFQSKECSAFPPKDLLYSGYQAQDITTGDHNHHQSQLVRFSWQWINTEPGKSKQSLKLCLQQQSSFGAKCFRFPNPIWWVSFRRSPKN